MKERHTTSFVLCVFFWYFCWLIHYIDRKQNIISYQYNYEIERESHEKKTDHYIEETKKQNIWKLSDRERGGERERKKKGNIKIFFFIW